MITLHVYSYDPPIYSALQRELAHLGIIKDLAAETPVRTSIQIRNDAQVLDVLEYSNDLSSDEIEQIRIWAAEKFGSACTVLPKSSKLTPLAHGASRDDQVSTKTAQEWLEFIASQPDQIASEAEIFPLDDDKATYLAKQARLDELVDAGKLVYIPLLAGTSGDGAYCLPESPRLQDFVRQHREWNKRFPAQARRWKQAKEFGERPI